MEKDVKLLLSVLFLSSFFLFAISAKEELIDTDPRIDTVIQIPQGHFDIGNKEHGTITISMDPNQYQRMLDKNKDKNVKYFIFFSSKVMPGLEIRYNIKEEVFEAGFPTFKTSKVNLMNGKGHMLAFTYKLGDKQAIFFDGQMIGYRPYFNSQGDLISGFTVKNLGTPHIIKATIDSNIMFTNYAMRPEEIQR